MSTYYASALNLNTLTEEQFASEVNMYNSTGRLSAAKLIGIGATEPTTIFGSNLHNRVANKFGGDVARLLKEFRPVRGIAAGGAPAASAGAKWNAAVQVKKSASDRLADAMAAIEALKAEVLQEAKAKVVSLMEPARMTASIVGLKSEKVTDEMFEAALTKAAVTDSEGALKVLVDLLKK